MKVAHIFCIVLVLCLLLQPRSADASAGSTQISGAVPLTAWEITASDIGNLQATISWSTNASATSQVFWDTQFHQEYDDYAFSSTEDATLKVAHSMTITGIEPATNYHFRIKSQVPDTGSQVVSEDHVIYAPAECFIATAVSNSTDAYQLNTLRAFRDQVLSESFIGETFISMYYRVSPPVAQYLTANKTLGVAVDLFFVTPVSWIIWLLMQPAALLSVIFLLGLALFHPHSRQTAIKAAKGLGLSTAMATFLCGVFLAVNSFTSASVNGTGLSAWLLLFMFPASCSVFCWQFLKPKRKQPSPEYI